MARSPLPGPGLPGPRLMAFMAGAVVMRRQAFEDAGGYEARLFLGAEERLLGLDLLSRGWDIVYAADVVTHHHPSQAGRDDRRRRHRVWRNLVWIAWMRLPWRLALPETLRLVKARSQEAGRVRWLAECLAGLPRCLASRRSITQAVAMDWCKVYDPSRGAAAGAKSLAADAAHQARGPG